MTSPNYDPSQPVPVHVASVSADVSIGSVPKQKSPRYRAHYETFVLTANDPVQCILPEDKDRVEAFILALDNDIVIGVKGQAGAVGNTTTNVPQPIGTYVPHTLTAPYPVKDCDALFAGVTTTASNSRVSVAAYYRC